MGLAQAATVVMLVGPGVKDMRAQEAVVRLAEATGYAVAVTPEGKVRAPTCSAHSCGVGMPLGVPLSTQFSTCLSVALMQVLISFIPYCCATQPPSGKSLLEYHARSPAGERDFPPFFSPPTNPFPS